MDAKCPKCEKKAQVSEDMKSVSCSHCGYGEDFDAYMERMKERVTNLVSDFQESDRGF